jgi:hypothetical protein
VGDIAGDFGGVETYNPDWVLVLPLEHVDDDRFEVRSLDVGFSVGATVSPKSSTTM